MGSSRGGVTTKIHAVTDGLGRCIDFMLTEGQIHDCTQAESLLEGKSEENVLSDKAHIPRQGVYSKTVVRENQENFG